MMVMIISKVNTNVEGMRWGRLDDDHYRDNDDGDDDDDDGDDDDGYDDDGDGDDDDDDDVNRNDDDIKVKVRVDWGILDKDSEGCLFNNYSDILENLKIRPF